MTQIEIPKEWTQRKLGEVCTNRYGYTAKSHKEEKGIPYLRITDINRDGTLKNEKVYVSISNKELDRYRLQKGDVVIARSGATVGKSFLFDRDEEYVFASYLIRFRPNPNEIIPKFLYYLLNSSHYWVHINKRQTVAAQPNINAKSLSDFRFNLPPVEVQKKIVQKLDYILTNLEEKKKAILESKEKQIRKIESLNSNFLVSVMQKYTPLTNIPSYWKVKKLSEIADVGQGGTPSRREPKYWNGIIPWLRSGELLNNRITDSKEKITKLGLEKSSAQLCPKGTILMAMTGQGLTRGRTAFLEIEACANQSCAHIITKSEDIITEYLWVFLQSRYWIVRSIHHGSGQPGINTTLIKQLDILVPPLDEQKQIIQKIDQEMRYVESINSKLKLTLTSHEKLRSYLEHIAMTIMDKAFSGKLVN